MGVTSSGLQVCCTSHLPGLLRLHFFYHRPRRAKCCVSPRLTGAMVPPKFHLRILLHVTAHAYFTSSGMRTSPKRYSTTVIMKINCFYSVCACACNLVLPTYYDPPLLLSLSLDIWDAFVILHRQQTNCSSCKLSIDVCALVETPFVVFKVTVAEKTSFKRLRENATRCS